jgi:hypothetical protein
MYVWRGVMGDHDEHAKRPPDGPEERRQLPQEWAKIVPLVIVVSIVIVTIMALAYSIGRSFWG